MATMSAEPTRTFTILESMLSKSSLDDREYRHLRLDANALHVLVVQDRNADRAAACMNVAVGHMSDPEDQPGVAHFCEHLLFQGNSACSRIYGQGHPLILPQRYPDPTSYKAFVKRHGGSTNASTSASNTSFHFSVLARHLKPTLDQWSGFFDSPLFSPSSVTREINAVHSENSKNQQMDSRRLYQLWKSLADSNHPWNKFGCGNKATLSLGSTDWDDSEPDGGSGGRNIRQRLLNWWESNYCANRMKLVIVGSESLDELSEMAAIYFSRVPNRGLDTSPIVQSPPWTGPSKLIAAKSLKDIRRLEVVFPIPSQHHHYPSKPTRTISHCLGHEGPGSIHHFLHQRGLITSLSASASRVGDGGSLVTVQLALTKSGLESYTFVLSAIWAYLGVLRSEQYPERLFRELREMASIRFQYANKESPDELAKRLATSLHEPYPLAHTLTGSQLLEDYNPRLIADIVNRLEISNARVFIAAKELDLACLSSKWSKEQWYGTEYQMVELSEALKTAPQLTQAQLDELHLPLPNEFIPKALQVDKAAVEKAAPRPNLILRNAHSELWHKKDDQFWRPKATFTCQLQMPLAYATPMLKVRTRMVVALVNDALVPLVYDANLSGFSHAISASDEGISIAVYGYSDGLDRFLHLVLTQLRDVQVRPDRFAMRLEKAKQGYDNFFVDQSGTVSDHFMRYTLGTRIISPDVLRAELEDLSMEDVVRHHSLLLRDYYSVSLAVGNLTAQQATAMQDQVQTMLKRQESSLFNELARSHLLPTACNLSWYKAVPNTQEHNSALAYYCHLGQKDDQALRTRADLFLHIINAEYFAVLRTKEQLGYNVTCARWPTNYSVGLRFRIQSERHPDYLEARLEAFFHHLDTTFLKDLSEDTFSEYRHGCAMAKRERLERLSEENSRFWAHISSGTLDFERAANDADVIDKLDLDDIRTFFMQFVHPSSPTRTKYSIRLVSQAVEPTGKGTESEHPAGIPLSFIDDLEWFKGTLAVSPSIVPPYPDVAA